MKKLLTIVSLLIATPVMAQVPSAITTKEQALEYIREQGEKVGLEQCAIEKRTDLLRSEKDREFAYLENKALDKVVGWYFQFQIGLDSPFYPALEKAKEECLNNSK